jgi:hypothetical protein
MHGSMNIKENIYILHVSRLRVNGNKCCRGCNLNCIDENYVDDNDNIDNDKQMKKIMLMIMITLTMINK